MPQSISTLNEESSRIVRDVYCKDGKTSLSEFTGVTRRRSPVMAYTRERLEHTRRERVFALAI
jgi:hypothetical protein